MDELDGEVAKIIAEEAKKPKGEPQAAPPPRAGSAASGGAGPPPRPASSASSTAPSSASAMQLSELEAMAAEKERVERQEREVRGTLEQRMRVMQEEAAKLASIRRELSALTEPARNDIQILRTNIEKAERELSYARKQYDYKKTEFEKAEAVLQDKVKAKDMLVRHLNVIVMDLTKKKEAKLQELTQKLSGAAAAVPHAAPASGAAAAGAPPPPKPPQKMFEGF